LPLRIRPMKLKRSIYLLVPSSIADLIDIDPEAEITLRIEEKDHRFLLIYDLRKSCITGDIEELNPLQMS